jgi:ubiquinol-cytochrome c reductase cytochrome b subunit
MSPLERTVNQVGDWLEARIGYRALIKHALEEPVPGGARWAYIFGSVLVGCIALQAITGWAMMAYYAPSATTAWASVEHLTYAVWCGWLVRGLHHFGSQAMIVVIGLHIAQVAIWGAYKAPREVNWWLGLGLLGVTIGFGLTGYLLPWDQKGYWATRVATNIAGTMPIAGKAVQRFLVGGPEYGSMTLTRFYTLHIAILPLLLALLLVGHLVLFRKHGVTPSASADTRKVDLFYPMQLAKDVGGVLLLLAVVLVLALRDHGAPLDAPADPASDYPARPEWYFLSLFQLLKYFPGPLEVVATLVVPGVAGAYLALLPFWDRTPSRALGPRMAYLAPLAGIGVGVVALTLLSMRSDAHDAPFQKARVLATQRADHAIELAKKGIPPDGPLAMMRRDPETRGAALFQEHCASCHRLGDMGPDVAKATAPDLTGWGTADWVLSVMDNPDDPHKFGNTPYKGEMISLVRPPPDPKMAPIFRPMPEDTRRAIATFLANEAAEVKDHHDGAGAKLVADRCTGCHLFRGQTDESDSIGPELSGWGSTAWVRAQIANPGTNATYRPEALSPERKHHMPRFDDKLEPDEINVLAMWVRGKARGAGAK